MTVSDARLRQVLAGLVIVLLVLPVGGALWLGVAHGESPCILCWAQRTSMILMALVALFIVRYGPRPRYVGLLVLLGAWGTFMGIRHASLHAARDIGQGFAVSILGAHTYIWAWVIHWLVLVIGGGLLLFVRAPLEARTDLAPGRVARFAMGLLVVLTAGNAVQAFISTGPPPYLGQGDPVRLSLDPRNWVWSLGELEGAVSWRGSWAVPDPDPSTTDPDPANGPLADLPTLAITGRERITAPVEGTLSGLATVRGPAGETAVLAVTEGHGVYLLDAAMSAVVHRVVVDPAYSIDLSPLAGAAFVAPDTLVVMSTNKSYVVLRPDAQADPDREWRHFLETDGGVSEVRRSRFATVRARLHYALSLAYDSAADELITVAVPSTLHPRLVVSRFDRRDFVLSSEFLPRPG
ncbi:MAG: disulfide bond formation protein B, partial [Gemmatimonadota bacterium]